MLFKPRMELLEGKVVRFRIRASAYSASYTKVLVSELDEDSIHGTYFWRPGKGSKPEDYELAEICIALSEVIEYVVIPSDQLARDGVSEEEMH